MKKNLYDTMKSSVEEEAKNVKEVKKIALADRFKIADEIFDTEEKKEVQAKVITDSFTCPEDDYKLINEIKIKYMKLGIGYNKSEIIRLGLIKLMELNEKELTQLGTKIKIVKKGRK